MASGEQQEGPLSLQAPKDEQAAQNRVGGNRGSASRAANYLQVFLVDDAFLCTRLSSRLCKGNSLLLSIYMALQQKPLQRRANTYIWCS